MEVAIKLGHFMIKRCPRCGADIRSSSTVRLKRAPEHSQWVIDTRRAVGDRIRIRIRLIKLDWTQQRLREVADMSRNTLQRMGAACGVGADQRPAPVTPWQSVLERVWQRSNLM
ncbi:hypothetical protein [Streptomyces parvus]|uniref:Uncharacterized protein n=1 Tax=Streptomyces parvus TaxID=66428 RepID=A0A7K3S5N9_9ACTN|nr:hypothetical protein [Streptomyces parvus]NEC22613.1 hypothetical protein [Streptomyces parvus]